MKYDPQVSAKSSSNKIQHCYIICVNLRQSAAKASKFMNQHLDKIDNDIAAKHLLKHPFYLAWTRGELSREALSDYARQYYHHVAAFPTYLSAMHAKCDNQSTRKELLNNLIDEEAGSPNHPELWLNFAEGLGVSDPRRAKRRNGLKQKI